MDSQTSSNSPASSSIQLDNGPRSDQRLNISVTHDQPFLKGKLTMISGLVLAFLEGPNVVEQVLEWQRVFSTAMNNPPSLLTVVAFLGMLYGVIRRRKNYFEKKPVAIIATPVDEPGIE